jgi:hypothetical protein
VRRGCIILSLGLAGAAAAAQPAAGPTLAPRILPPSCREAQARGEEIVVCGERDFERYRVPAPLRQNGFDKNGPVDSVSRERNGLLDHGASGIGSCSTSGIAGWTGCFHNWVRRGREQKGN